MKGWKTKRNEKKGRKVANVWIMIQSVAVHIQSLLIAQGWFRRTVRE